MLTRFDPLQQLDRLVGGSPVTRAMPMDAYRHGDDYIIELDLPGLAPDSIDVTVERNVLQVTAERRPRYSDGDDVLVAERPMGKVTRHVHLGGDVNGGAIQADYRDGVLVVRLPVAETAKPHKVEVAAGGGQKTLTAQAS